MSKKVDYKKKYELEKEDTINKYKSSKKIQRLVQEYNTKKGNLFYLVTNGLSLSEINHLMSERILKEWKTKEQIEAEKKEKRVKKFEAKLNEKELKVRKELINFNGSCNFSSHFCIMEEDGSHTIGIGLDVVHKIAKKLKSKYSNKLMKKVLRPKEYNETIKNINTYSNESFKNG